MRARSFFWSMAFVATTMFALGCHHDPSEKQAPIASAEIPAPSAAASIDTADSQAAPPTTAETPPTILTPAQQREKILAGIAVLEGFVQRREKRGRETDAECQRVNDIERPNVEGAMSDIGETWMTKPTRFSKTDPDALVEDLIGACIMCTSSGFGNEPAFPPQCPKARTALSDLAIQVKAQK